MWGFEKVVCIWNEEKQYTYSSGQRLATELNNNPSRTEMDLYQVMWILIVYHNIWWQTEKIIEILFQFCHVGERWGGFFFELVHMEA